MGPPWGVVETWLVQGARLNDHVVIKKALAGFLGGSVVKNLPARVGDMDLIPGLGRYHMPQDNRARAPQLLSLHSGAHENSKRSRCNKPVNCN